jgi:hypothetical protein
MSGVGTLFCELLRGTVFFVLGMAAVLCGKTAWFIWRAPPWEMDRILRKRKS